jgi:ubiquinone/menaquinone biosynthesis C-methylase UbiE
MPVIGWTIRMLAKGLDVLGLTFTRLANLLWELVPAILPPDQLARHVQTRYDAVYTTQSAPTKAEMEDDNLDAWEVDVLNRYRITSGRMLAMGTGWGREALAIARKGVTVVGVEWNPVAVRETQRFAEQAGISACFHRADFTALPYADGSFDFALLATTMYSAIPGTAGRQAWLDKLGRLLKPGGLALLSFERELPPPPRTRAIIKPVIALLQKLPGANCGYRIGDSYSAEHYMHAFQDEEEIRAELIGAGASIRELGWVKGYAIVTFPNPQDRNLIS